MLRNKNKIYQLGNSKIYIIRFTQNSSKFIITVYCEKKTNLGISIPIILFN